MCKKKEARKPLVFMNTPIQTPEEDIIGFSTQVEKLDAAIECGGQMIAVTSPFGAGKTSIIELLQRKYLTEKSKKRIVTVSMWSHLCKGTNAAPDGETTELHRSFVYQLISQVAKKRGEYVSKRLSPNYGLLKLSTNSIRYWFLLILSIALFFIGYVLPEKLEMSLPILGEKASSIESLMIIAAIILFLYVLTRAEVVFSSNKSEGERKIETSEVMQLYRSEILKYRLPWLFKFVQRPKHYIVVVEDLDRTDNDIAVINFLKELRKYYFPEASSKERPLYLNRVTFLINVKPETKLCEAHKDDAEYGHLYEKLFDYILNLQTINIDDYETILEGLLQQQKEAIQDLGLRWTGKMLNIVGMRWIVRGAHLGIREIKERLNIACSLYESLSARFSGQVSFETCAIVAYVTTEFEEDFYNTSDKAFQDLVNLYIKNGSFEDTDCEAILPGASEKYISEIEELVKSKRIDSNYRMYFYNYPQNSRIFTSAEAIVQRAILYGERPDSLHVAVDNVLQLGSTIVKDTFDTRKQLGLLLPDVVFEEEPLYLEALKGYFPDVSLWVGHLDYSADAAGKTIKQILRLLGYDAERDVYGKSHAIKFCNIWEDSFSETSLLQLRKMLCAEHPRDILWYKQLFHGVHRIASEDELALIPLSDALSLVNLESDDFSDSHIEHLVTRFISAQDADAISATMETFLRNSKTHITGPTITNAYLAYMSKIERIIPDFETSVYEKVREDENFFPDYQNVINLVADQGLSTQTLKYIRSIGKYDGYSKSVAEQMDVAGYTLDSVLLLLHQNNTIPFERQDVAETLQEELDWLLDNGYLLPLRQLMLDYGDGVFKNFEFMFGERCPIITEPELRYLEGYNIGLESILNFIPAKLVSTDDVDVLKKTFCQKKLTNDESYAVLCYLSNIDENVVYKMFYALDFDKVRYRYISASRKNQVKKLLETALDLDTTSGRIEFMLATKFLDSEWELELVDDLKADQDLQKKYVQAVNSSEKITKTTIHTLCAIGSLYPMKESVIEKFFEFKRYKEYVVCKTISANCFELESGERGTLLWPVYLDVFGNGGYPQTRKHMGKNHTFLTKIMAEKAYVGINNQNILPLAQLLQDQDCIKYIVECTNTFALDYLTKIRGFADRDAAVAFVNAVEQNATLLASDELYKHTHEKLLDGQLKRKYTLARAKEGYSK